MPRGRKKLSGSGVMAGFNHRTLRKHKLPEDIAIKQTLVKVGNYVAINPRISVDLEKDRIYGKVEQVLDKGICIISESGWRYPTWDKVKEIFLEKGQKIESTHTDNYTLVKLFHASLDKLKEAAQKLSLECIDTQNPRNYVLRSLSIRFDTKHILVLLKDDEMICESNFCNRKSKVKVNGNVINDKVLYTRLNFLKREIKKSLREKKKQAKEAKKLSKIEKRNEKLRIQQLRAEKKKARLEKLAPKTTYSNTVIVQPQPVQVQQKVVQTIIPAAQKSIVPPPSTPKVIVPPAKVQNKSVFSIGFIIPPAPKKS